MKFKRILAVILSVLMPTSMASFTVSAEDAELMAEPVLSFITVSNQGKLANAERGKTSINYDVENDIVYTRSVPNFEVASGTDNSMYANMHGLSPAFAPTAQTMYVVWYMRSNQSTDNSHVGFYGGLQGKYTGGSAGAYAGDEKWAKMMAEITFNDGVVGNASSNHFWARPIGGNTVNQVENNVVVGKVMAEDAYYDMAGIAIFGDRASAEAYDIAALSSGKITISFDAGDGTGDFEPYKVAAGKYAPSTIVFPEEIPTAPEGMAFNGWAAEKNGTPLTGDVATPDVNTTYYATYKYAEQEGVEYDDIYLQNVYYKLMNDKNLTIGYLGGSVTVGSGPKSTTAWRALTTQWFKDNFPQANIKEVYAGIGGTGSRFASYRMTRDLDLANNTLDLLFVDSCVNDQYEGFSYANKEDLWGNDAVIVAKALANNPKCQIVFVNVCNNGTILSAGDSGTVQAHREFADANGFEFIDFKVGMARELMGDDTAVNATQAAVDAKWKTYFTDSVHPADAGYKVYFEYLRDELLADLVNDELTLSKAKYEDTVPASLDLDTVDTERYSGGAASSNSLTGLNTIKNYLLGQQNGFLGGDSISAAAEGYSTTFKFTGKNAYIWGNKQSRNALLDVYLDDNTTIGSPDYTIDMWRNQDMSQSFMFPVLPNDLDEAREVKVTLVLRKNVDQATRDQAAGRPAADVGERMLNVINNISVKGGTMDSVEFMASPEEFIKKVEYPDIVVPAKELGLAVDPGNSMSFELTEYDGKTVMKSKYNGNGGTGGFVADGYHIRNFGNVIGEYYNFATYYFYLDDPQNKTAGKIPTVTLRQEKHSSEFFTADTAVTPNAWQRISIDFSKIEENNTVANDVLVQFHAVYLPGAAKNYEGVTVYAEKVVFSAEDPGDWADLDAKVTNIKVNGESVKGFNKDVFEYTVELPFGTTEIPVVEAEKMPAEADVVVEQATEVEGTAKVTLKGASVEDDIVYTINFEIFDGIRLNGINAGETAVALKDGITEYRVTLPAGTTAVPTVTADIEGDPAKITITQADSLEGAARVAVEGGVTYTITFYVMPSLEDRYPGADIVYVSSTGAGTKDGSSLENAMKWEKKDVNDTKYFAPLYDKKDSESQVVYAVVDDIVFDSNVSNYVAKEVVFTSAGGDIRATNHPSFHESCKATITFENIDIYHTTTSTTNANNELYLTTRGNNLIMNNVNAYPYDYAEGHYGEGKHRTDALYVQPGGDGGNFNVNEDLFVNLTNVNGVIVRGGGWGGTTINKGIIYTIDGESRINSVLAGGHAVKGDLPADQRTIRGDVKVSVAENSYVGSVSAGNSSIVDGKMIYVIEGEIDSLVLGANSTNGSVTGGVIATITGKVGSIARGNLNTDSNRVVIINTDTAEVGNIDGATHLIKYSGNGEVVASSIDDGDEIEITLSSETAKWAEVTIDGVTKKYDMSTDTEVTLAAEDMIVKVPADKETVIRFEEGTGVTFKALEADGAKADSTETVTGLAGMTVPAPEAAEVKNEYFEFVGWALEGTTDIVTDFGKFTDEAVTYVAIFKEAPAVQFKATVEAGAAEAMDETIYGTTGAAVTAPNAPAAKAHFSFKGWAVEGTTEIVTDFGVFADEKAVYVAVYEEDAKATITVYDGNDKIAEVTDYAGFTFTFEKLDHTPTTRFVGYKLDGETEATIFAGDEITVTANATYYAVRNEIKLEDAEYTFEGKHYYSGSKYIVEMYYVGPKANMTAFGFAYDTNVLANLDVEYSEELQSTGTNKIDDADNGVYIDVVYPTEGASFGDDMKTPVHVATLTFNIADYASLDTETAIIAAIIDEDITGAYANGNWQYIKHSEDFSLDIAANVYPIFFTELVDDNAITVTVEGVDADITTVTAPTEGKMLEAVSFTAVTADGEEPGLVSYYVDGVPMGEIVAEDDGITYVIPAENVLGNITIEFSYGEPILEVAITGIDTPEVGEEPDTTAKIPANVNFTLGNVTWEPEADEFDFDTAYTVKVEVNAEEGYAFSGKTVYTINGEAATVKKLDKDTVEVSYTFESTVKELGTVTVSAGLVRDEADRAYANFGTISVIDAEGNVVASYTETAEDAALAAEFEVLAGTYTVEIAKNGYLTYTKEIAVVYNKTTTVKTDLVAGNLYAEGEDDNVIDLFDFVRLTKAFTAETDVEDADALEAYRATVDIDEDGVVTVFDLALIKANIGE